MRCKGKFNCMNEKGEKALYIMQGVGDLFELREVSQVETEEPPRFLFVGRKIDASKI